MLEFVSVMLFRQSLSFLQCFEKVVLIIYDIIWHGIFNDVTIGNRENLTCISTNHLPRVKFFFLEIRMCLPTPIKKCDKILKKEEFNLS